MRSCGAATLASSTPATDLAADVSFPLVLDFTSCNSASSRLAFFNVGGGSLALAAGSSSEEDTTMDAGGAKWGRREVRSARQVREAQEEQLREPPPAATLVVHEIRWFSMI